MNLINFHKSTVIKITLEHQKNLIHKDIKKYANVVENRLDDEWCTLESVLEDNTAFLELATKNRVNYVLIDEKYEVDIAL